MFLQVKVQSEAMLSNTVENQLPLLIGNIPLRSQAFATPAPITIPSVYPTLQNGGTPGSSNSNNGSIYPSAPQPNAQAPLPGWIAAPPSYQEAVYGNEKPTSEELDVRSLRKMALEN